MLNLASEQQKIFTYRNFPPHAPRPPYGRPPTRRPTAASLTVWNPHAPPLEVPFKKERSSHFQRTTCREYIEDRNRFCNSCAAMNPLTTLTSLTLTLAIGISSALPIQHDRDTDSIHVMLLSLHTGQFVQVNVGGLVTAVIQQHST